MKFCRQLLGCWFRGSHSSDYKEYYLLCRMLNPRRYCSSVIRIFVLCIIRLFSVFVNTMHIHKLLPAALGPETDGNANIFAPIVRMIFV
jgi:hypothetical protein